MLNWLRGSHPLSLHEISFMDDRFREGQTYIPFSYFKGATPENDYTPDEPFSVTVKSNPTSDDTPGYMKLLVTSSGAIRNVFKKKNSVREQGHIRLNL